MLNLAKVLIKHQKVLYDHQIFYLNVKPENVILVRSDNPQEDFEYKLIDFENAL